MWLTTYFESTGIPATGLTPIIKIRNIDDGNISASGTMTEIGNGFYKYSFDEYDITKDYCIFCDALSLSNKDRYKFSATEGLGNEINLLNTLNDNVDEKATIIRKILTNKMILINGNISNSILYDDNNSSELFVWNIADKNGNEIIQQPRQVSGRTKGE